MSFNLENWCNYNVQCLLVRRLDCLSLISWRSARKLSTVYQSRKYVDWACANALRHGTITFSSFSSIDECSLHEYFIVYLTLGRAPVITSMSKQYIYYVKTDKIPGMIKRFIAPAMKDQNFASLHCQENFILSHYKKISFKN